MEAQTIHDLRLKINQIRNTTKRAVTVQKYKRKSYDQLVSVEEAHDLLLKAEDSLKYATYWLGKVLDLDGAPKPDYSKGVQDTTKKGIQHDHKDDENILVVIRTAIQQVIDEADAIVVPKEQVQGRNVARCFTAVYVHLNEAKFAVGELKGELDKEEKARKKEEKQEELISKEQFDAMAVSEVNPPVDEVKENGTTEGEVQK